MTGLLAVVGLLLVLNLLFAAGVVLLRIRSDYRARRFTRIENTWDPIVVGVVSGADQDVPSIPDAEAEHILQIAGRFARRLRGPDRDKVQAFAAPVVGLLHRDLTSRSPETRAAAVELLGVLALESYGDSIVNALGDPSPRVSLVAARALLQPESSRHVPAVLEQIHRYATWSPSLMSSMLAQAGTDAVVDLRLYLADTERPSQARAVVAGALRLLRDPLSAQVAADSLGSHDPELVVACLRLLETVGSSTQAEAVRGLVDHPAFFVRSEAVTVLGRIGDARDVETVAAMAEWDSPWVAIRSARALLDLGERSLLEELAAGSGLGADSAREVLQGAGLR